MTKYEVAFTGDVTDPESASEGMYREAGWVNPEWSMRVLYENKEDIKVYVFDTLEEAEAKIEEVIGETDTDGGGSYYAKDSSSDYRTGDEWSYAGHVTEL